jgi:hypothetical protein
MLSPEIGGTLSSDQYEVYYFLTNGGWLPSAAGTLTDAPQDWLRLYVVRVQEGSPFGRTSSNWILQEANPDISRAIVDEVEARSPRPGTQETTAETLSALIDRINIK